VVDAWTMDGDAWRCDPIEVVKAHSPSWSIPGSEEASRLWSLVSPVPQSRRTQFYDDFGTRFRYSAASLSIRFLQSNPTITLFRMRKIVLLEDYMSLTNSPSHAQGLVRFCRLNRIVNLWRAGISPDDKPGDPLRTSIISKAFGRWILEALELRKRGMPVGSFRLLLDGDPILEKASQIFEAVKGDVARQVALDLCYERNILPRPSWFERRRRFGYQWEGLPQAITDLQNGEYASFIECNFDLGAAYDPERLIEERVGWTAEEWEDEWAERGDDKFDTEAPLPPWRKLHPICTYSKASSIGRANSQFNL
jgi:hypothetical protein